MNKKKQILVLDLRKLEDTALLKFLDFLGLWKINWIWLDDYKKRKKFHPYPNTKKEA